MDIMLHHNYRQLPVHVVHTLVTMVIIEMCGSFVVMKAKL